MIINKATWSCNLVFLDILTTLDGGVLLEEILKLLKHTIPGIMLVSKSPVCDDSSSLIKVLFFANSALAAFYSRD